MNQSIAFRTHAAKFGLLRLFPVAFLTAVIGQAAWANGVWPTEYRLSYKSYTSPTNNQAEVSYRLPVGDGCRGYGSRPRATTLDGIGMNWCKTTDDAWQGQFWGPWNVGPDPQPTCSDNWKPDEGGGWWHGGLGEEIWTPGGNYIRRCGDWFEYTIPQPLAPGKWAIGINFWEKDGWIFHHNSGNHNTNRVFELKDPNAPNDEDEDED